MTLRKELIDELLKESEGQDLFGKDGLLSELTGRLVERALEAELTEHLGYEKDSPAASQHPNSRNGHTAKTLRGKSGTVRVKVPRDRQGTFEPLLVPKHARSLPGFDERVIALYGRGLATREIAEHLEDLYHTSVSRDLISRVTDAVMEDAEAWQNRPLETVYPLLYLDALFVKMRTPAGVRKRAVYVALGVNLEGRKDILGLWMADEEKASFWLRVLTELKNRGLEDVFICCVDGLAGFEEAIEAALPKTIVQQCIVHLIRRSTRYVARKDRKAVCGDLRSVYRAPTAEAARRALEEAGAKWTKYPHLTEPWKKAWDRVIPFFDFPKRIRRIIYTTNAIESLNRSLRRVLKTRGAFPSEKAVRKVLYLAIRRKSTGWQKKSVDHWRETYGHFHILFRERIPEEV